MLKVDNLCASYGKVQAITGICLEVEAGKVATILGPNGAGKTTVLKAVSGLLPCGAGRCSFQGEDISRMTAEAIIRKGIVHVPEGRKVFPFMTVTENLELGAYLRRDKEGIAADMEAVFQRFPKLKERHRQSAGTLSGGEQQMLAIGRGLMARPKLFLLDEPSMGLSPKLVEEVFSVIDQLHRQGLTILLVEQNASLALEVSDLAYILEAGSLIRSGSAADMVSDPAIRKSYLGLH